jgi:hypothetical protein
MDLKNLTKEIPCKWRVQSASKNKPSAQCVAYIDARQAEDLLDSVVGAENWQVDYKEVNGLLMAGVAIWVDVQWVWKWDTGSVTKVEKDKGHVSDSFKRACVKWGVGRFLYSKDIKYIDTNATNTGSNYPYPVDKSGARIWDLTKHFNA